MEKEDTVKIKIEEEKPNEIVEIDENEEITSTQYDLPITDRKKTTKKSGGRSKLSRKAKITIIVILSVLLLIGIGIIIYFIIKGNGGEPEIEKPQEEVVIVEKDNYRFQNGKLVLKEDNNDIGEYTCKNNNDVLCYVAYFSNEDTFDVTEKVYETGIKIQNRSDIYKKQFVFIYDNEEKEDGNLILYDIKNNKNLGEYKLVKEINNDKAIVKDLEDNYQVLVFDSDATKLLEKEYDYIGYITDSDKLVVASNNNYQLLDLTGKEDSKEVPGEIKNFDNNNLSVLIDKSEYVYNYDGEKVIDKAFDYIRFTSDYIIGAINKKLYVYDSEGSPMIIDGIRISSNKYNTRLIYGTDLKQTGREVAFDAFVTGTNMRIEYGEDYQVINLNEGAFSKNLKYVNYIQGKLYFYSDEAKTTVIGTYVCKNENTVNADTTELSNCFIAKESSILKSNDINSYLPIYNKRFVFINDVDSAKRGSIVLYDLANDKEIISYLQIDAEYHKDSGIAYVETAGTLIVAKNSSNSYRVINISTNEVSNVISSKYTTDSGETLTNTEIKKLDQYYLIKRSDGTYHLYDPKGVDKEITKGLTTSNEIVKLYDKYVMVKSGNKYLIYSLDGTIISLEYKYIIMTDLVYVCINDNDKLEAYKYSDKNTNLITDDISVDNNKITASVRGSILTINYTSGGESLYQEINIDNPNPGGDDNG